MRSGKVIKRLIKPDPIYHSVLVAKLINKVMVSGKKTIATTLVYKALENIKQQSKSEPLAILEKAMENITPKMEVRPRRVGGASYQVPMEVRGERKETLAIRWLILAARGKSNKEFHSFDQKLAVEIMDGANQAGGAFKKKEDMQKVANANRAFAHFRW